MGKYIVLAAAIVLLYWLVRSALRRRTAQRRRDSPPGVTEDMVRCAQCGVHLPRGESLMAQGEVFCSSEHRQQFSGRGKGR